MNDKQLKTANIENLTQLWKQMGARPCFLEGMEKFQMSVSWPNRCWIESELLVDEISTIAHCIYQTTEDVIVPVWVELGGLTEQLESILTSSGFEALFEQTAMYLDLKNYPIMGQSDLELLPIDSERDIRTWTDIAARSFEYEIDNSVIQKIAVNSNVKLFMAYLGDHPAATAMLFNTGDVTGVHQMGVLPEYRGQGIARKLMQDIINLCIQMPARYITLQASTAGEPLYSSLGFKRQFKIQNYQRTIKVNS